MSLRTGVSQQRWHRRFNNCPSGGGHIWFGGYRFPWMYLCHVAACALCSWGWYEQRGQLPLSGPTLHRPHGLTRTLQGWWVKVRCQHVGESQREPCSHTEQLSEKWAIETSCTLPPQPPNLRWRQSLPRRGVDVCWGELVCTCFTEVPKESLMSSCCCFCADLHTSNIMKRHFFL